MTQYKFHETKTALSDKKLILKSYPKSIQSKLFYLVNDILYNPRNLDSVGKPEELKHQKIPTFSRELTQKDRILYEIKPGMDYGMPEEKEIVVFLHYLGHYLDK
jgi:toxin YoeB